MRLVRIIKRKREARLAARVSDDGAVLDRTPPDWEFGGQYVHSPSGDYVLLMCQATGNYWTVPVSELRECSAAAE